MREGGFDLLYRLVDLVLSRGWVVGLPHLGVYLLLGGAGILG